MTRAQKAEAKAVRHLLASAQKVDRLNSQVPHTASSMKEFNTAIDRLITAGIQWARADEAARKGKRR